MTPFILGISVAWALEIAAYGTVLSAPSSNVDFGGGIGAPTVDYDAANDQWVMFFEGKATHGAGVCDTITSIGRATSPDGIDWAMDAAPVIRPDPSVEVQQCAVGHPAVVYDGSVWHLVYATGYRVTMFWGDTIGGGSLMHVTSPDGVTWSEPEVVVPIETPNGFAGVGLPSLTLSGGELFLGVMYPSEGYVVTRPNYDSATWSDPVRMHRTSSSYDDDGVYSPSMNCDPDLDPPLVMYGMTKHKKGKFFRASSADGVNWTSDPEGWVDLGPIGDKDLRHIDVLRVAESSDDFVLYFSAKEGTIGAASTLTTWPGTASRVCASAFAGQPADPGPAASGVAGVVGEGAPPETQAEAADLGCGCASARPVGAAWAVGLVLLGLRRRG